MSWRDQIRTPSFRGAQFQIEGHTEGGGRRGQNHEYPLRDKSYFEDLGQKAPEYSIEAFIVGGDYFVDRDRLKEALRKSGPGKLIHPYLGELTVAVSEWQMSERISEGRVARFSITFVPAGERIFPTTGDNPRGRVLSASDDAVTVVQEDFAKDFSVRQLPGFVADSVSDAGIQLADIVSVMSTAAEVQKTVIDFKAGISAYIANPTLLASKVGGLISTAFDAINTEDNVFLNGKAILGGKAAAIAMQNVSGFSLSSVISGLPTTTLTRVAQSTALNQFQKLAQGIGFAKESSGSVDWKFASYDGAIKAMRDISGRMEELIISPGLSDGSFNALSKLRAEVVKDLSTRAGGLPKIKEVIPPTEVPALVMAYELYEDATRDADIIDRNGISIPGFIPRLNGVEVLSA